MGVPKLGVSHNGWSIEYSRMENPTKMDDFRGTPILGNLHLIPRGWASEIRITSCVNGGKRFHSL